MEWDPQEKEPRNRIHRGNLWVAIGAIGTIMLVVVAFIQSGIFQPRHVPSATITNVTFSSSIVNGHGGDECETEFSSDIHASNIPDDKELWLAARSSGGSWYPLSESTRTPSGVLLSGNSYTITADPLRLFAVIMLPLAKDGSFVQYVNQYVNNPLGTQNSGPGVGRTLPPGSSILNSWYQEWETIC